MKDKRGSRESEISEPYQRWCSKELDVVNSVGCCGVVKLDENCIVNWIWMGGDQ